MSAFVTGCVRVPDANLCFSSLRANCVVSFRDSACAGPHHAYYCHPIFAYNDYCRAQSGADEGRDAFKSLKNQQIADKSALLYSQWAELEVTSGQQAGAYSQVHIPCCVHA